jgi:glycosyltransferase involved in cell wall biosynthesis
MGKEAKSTTQGGSQHVVMLVNNPCVNDSRVIKSAEAVARTGRRVTVVCRQHGDLPEEEERAGVRYVRIQPAPLNWRMIWQRLLMNAENPAVSGIRRLSLTRVILFPFAVLAMLLLYAGRVIIKIARRVRRLIKATRRFVILRTKPLLRSIYWLFEADEFGAAAETHLRKMAPDVIHAHDLSTLPLGGRVAKYTGARLIYDSHELEMHRNASYPRFVKFRRRQMESKYIRRADRVITVSESIADHLHNDYGIQRPAVVMNAPLFDHAATPERDLRSDLELEHETPLAVYVGSVTINRGIEEMVRALAYAPELHFATVGPRRLTTVEEVAAVADELGVRDRLHFVDPVAPQDVVSYVSTAGVSVLPIQNVCLSYYYCMPNKLLESVFAGVPVAVANLLEMRRFVELHGCGVVMDETDPQDIARAVTEVLKNRERYILSPQAREQLAHNYGWPAQAERLRNVYDALSAVRATNNSSL